MRHPEPRPHARGRPPASDLDTLQFVYRPPRIDGEYHLGKSSRSYGTNSEVGAAPTALGDLLLGVPALTGWASFLRASGAWNDSDSRLRTGRDGVYDRRHSQAN
jgi:hypothetical protein